MTMLMTTISSYLIVFVGAGMGGMLRHAANVASFHMFGPDLPVGTLAVNVLGSLCMGALAGHFALKGQTDPQMRLFLITGILGGFTTFSAFSLETALLWERGQVAAAAAYVAASVILSIAGVFVGIAAMR